jgi:hypothetical protein
MSFDLNTINLVEYGLDDYEANESVLIVFHDLIKFFESPSNCNCRESSKDIRKCFQKIGFKNFFIRHFEFKGLDDKELDLSVKTQLMIFQFNNENNDMKKYKYQYNASLSICQSVFLKLCNITEHRLKTLRVHLQTNGLEERTHGNLRKVPILNSRALVDYETADMVKKFILQYASIHGLPSPLRLRDNSESITYLPTEKKYTSIYNEYINNVNLTFNQSVKISYDTFRNLWHQLTPSIKFQTAASDLCDTCEVFRQSLKNANNDDEKENIEFNFKQHRDTADIERQHYNKINEKSKNDSITHICYDWAQSLTAPYSPQQVGPIYFKSPFVFHLFGVCKTGGVNHQSNYIIGEDQFPKGVSKGANTTLNMVYHFLQKIAPVNKKDLHVTCDNCSGQNKNNLSLWFWSWVIMLGWYENVYLHFMIPGHTKFICDSFFGLIKKTYRDRRINIDGDIVNAVNDSSQYNEAIICDSDLGWKWHDFNSLFKNHFRNLPNIKKYHHFHFSSLENDIGKVYVTEKSGGSKVPFNLFKNNNFDKNAQLSILEVAPLTDERKAYLYTKIRQHVDDQFKDTLCPEPHIL